MNDFRAATSVEWPVFKQHLPRWLQPDRADGLPIVVGDPAYIDVLYWTEQKRLRQAIVSRYAFDPGARNNSTKR